MSTDSPLFEWTDQKREAAILLAQGFFIKEAAKTVGVNEKTVRRWKEDIDFAAEIDRLSLILDIAQKAERLRIAMRVVRQKTKGTRVQTRVDLLRWLEFAQSETDGAKRQLEIGGRLNVENLTEALERIYGRGNNQSG